MYSATRLDESAAVAQRRIAMLKLAGAIAARIFRRTHPAHPASDWARDTSCELENEAYSLEVELKDRVAA